MLYDPSGQLKLGSMRPVAKKQHAMELMVAKNGEERKQVTKKVLVGNDEAFVLENVLSVEECQDLVDKSEATNDYSFWCEDESKHLYRSAFTVEINSQSLADALFERMKEFAPKVVELNDDSDPRWARDIHGRWEAYGINPCMLFARYRDFAHFSPHTDGNTIYGLNDRSFYTVLVYLNTCEVGGATNILELKEGQSFILDENKRLRPPPDSIIGASHVRTGNVLFFYQDLMHEGEPVGKGHCKYIIRTDLMFHRVPPVCAGEKDQEAYRIMKEAEDLEADGKCDEAAKLFRKAFRMSQELADIYGM